MASILDALRIIKEQFPKFANEAGIPFLGEDQQPGVMAPEDPRQQEKIVLEALLKAAGAAIPAGKVAGFLARSPKTLGAITAAGTGDPTAILNGPLGLLLQSNEAGAAFRWQGSPNYIKDTSFDMTKLGTGEGNQVIAKGHYVAENPEIADEYRRSLASRNLINKLLEIMDPEDLSLPLTKALSKQSSLTSTEKSFLATLHNADYLGYDSPLQAIHASTRKNAPAQFDLGDQLTKQLTRLGHLYKVDVPDEAIVKMLNFDKPIKEQPHIQALLKESNTSVTVEDTGRDLYKSMEGKLGAEAASRWFDSKGIPGVVYSDKGTRKGATSTTNNVLFRDDLARILEKNGKATGESPWLPGEYGYKEATEAQKDAAMANILQFLDRKGIVP